jgi:hypothetical protein
MGNPKRTEPHSLFVIVIIWVLVLLELSSSIS